MKKLNHIQRAQVLQELIEDAVYDLQMENYTFIEDSASEEVKKYTTSLDCRHIERELDKIDSLVKKLDEMLNLISEQWKEKP